MSSQGLSPSAAAIHNKTPEYATGFSHFFIESFCIGLRFHIDFIGSEQLFRCLYSFLQNPAAQTAASFYSYHIRLIC